ncbi:MULTISPECIES: hypothetical protein [unclassified Halomonas]|uniref:hypothetical protein n=1 Tax=unclassified Halomonas TaxID=2609666 RepID=UPI001EF61B5B|nr:MULTISPECIES: hypothetical protein [unclassified Halomonas]MCG7591997.1 hypothetical protein [Halomonas sp. McD50-5]MCG7617916.1 hypothetical protein [Halomonas sp. McD50-4]
MIDNFRLAHQCDKALRDDQFSLCYDLIARGLRSNPGDALLIVVLAKLILKNPKFSFDFDFLVLCVANFMRIHSAMNKKTAHVWHAISIINSHVMRFSDHQSLKDDKLFFSNFRLPKRKNKKIVILTCVWKRHDLTRLFLNYYQELFSTLDDQVSVQIVAVGSEKSVSRSICEAGGAIYIEHPNDPLSQKWQAGLDYCKALDFDALIVLGSDDFICSATFQHYCSLIDKGVLFAGFQDCYLHDYYHKKTIYWKGYGYSGESQSQPHRLGETIGLGRFLHRALLEYMEFDLWGGVSANKSLDSIMMNKVKSKTGFLPLKYCHLTSSEAGHNGFTFGLISSSLKDLGLFGVDVKVSDNITSFEKYCSSNNVYEDVSNQMLNSSSMRFLEKYGVC